MMVRHKFLIHAICPFVDYIQWDYYEVVLQTEDTIDVAIFEKAMHSVRNIRQSQEMITAVLRQQLPEEVRIEVTGTHSLSSSTTVFA